MTCFANSDTAGCGILEFYGPQCPSRYVYIAFLQESSKANKICLFCYFQSLHSTNKLNEDKVDLPALSDPCSVLAVWLWRQMELWKLL